MIELGSSGGGSVKVFVSSGGGFDGSGLLNNDLDSAIGDVEWNAPVL